MSQNKLQVILLSAGLGSRLQKFTRFIPKSLVNIGANTALIQQIKFWHKYDPDVINIVVHPKYESIVSGYLRANDILTDEYNIKIKLEPEHNGSARAINRVLEDESFSKYKTDCIINWSDIIPVTNIDINRTESTIFTNGNQCRFTAKGNTVFPVDGGGNVIGIYYVNDIQRITPLDFSEMEKTNDTPDFVDYIALRCDFVSTPIRQIIDFGDINKLTTASKDIIVTREFNKIQLIPPNKIRKIALNDKGLKLQADELEWYRSINEISGPGGCSVIPKIVTYTNDSFDMEHVCGEPVYKHEYFVELLDEIKSTLNQIHTLTTRHVSTEDMIADVLSETVEKTEFRYNIIKEMLSGFPIIESVNGLPIRNSEQLMQLLSKRILDINKAKCVDSDTVEYCTIHGDPNFSNIIADINGSEITVKLIDPRGYFGKTKLFGLKSYDFGKVLYACSGYDEFNSNPAFVIDDISYVDGLQNLEVKMPHWLMPFGGGCSKFDEESYLWMAVNWINLGGYFKNNPVKSFVAYNYGLYMAELVLSKSFSIRQLTDGSSVPELSQAIDISIKTKCPAKWTLTDNETGQSYRATGSTELFKMWEQIND